MLPPGYQFGRPVIAAACDPVEPLGERPLDACALLVHEASERVAVDPLAGRGGQAVRHPGQRHAARRHVGRAAQQQQVLQRAGFDDAVAVLPQSDQAALDDLDAPFFGRLTGRGHHRAARRFGRTRASHHGHPREMEEVRRAGVRVDEEGAAPGLVLVPRQQRGAEPVEHRLAGMEPDDVRPIRGSVDRETAVRAGRVDFHGGEHGIQAAAAFLGETKDAVRIAVDAQIDQRRRGGDEPAEVAG